MHTFEIESIEGVGYLVFAQLNERRTKCIDKIFSTRQQVNNFIKMTKQEGFEIFDKVSEEKSR